MLTLKTLRDNPEMVVAKLAKKNFDAKAIVAEILDLDTLRRSLQTESDALKSAQNQMASRIGMFMKQGQKEEAEKAKAEVAGMKEKYNDMIARLDQLFKILDRDRRRLAVEFKIDDSAVLHCDSDHSCYIPFRLRSLSDQNPF